MIDLISRQAAIDAMTNTLWHYPNECYRNLNEYEFAKGLAELGLKSVPSAQQWIPCRKKLPRIGKNVLISMDDENVTVGRIVKIGKAKMWQIDIGEYPIDTFGAWMPTPKPYEVEE